MKKIISIIIGLLLIMSFTILACAGETPYTVVSDSEELIEAINNAENNSVIYLKGGRYSFTEGFSFENIKKNITLSSADGETAIFTTAYNVNGWQKCTVNGIDALCVSANGKTVTSLFSDGNKLQRARLPETGFYYLEKSDTSDTKGEGDSLGTNGFYAHEIDFTPESPEDITVGIVHWWVNELSPMVSYDLSTGLIKTEKYTGLVVKEGDRYYLENVKESLDKAGEWCFDSSEDKIYYIPQNGETAENLCLYASSEAEMLKINNCSGITFKNIEFAETAFTYGDEKHLNTDIHTADRTWANSSFQSATDAPGAVTVTYSDNINFVNCEFRNIGCTAIKYFNGSKQCKTENCLFDSVGASALFIGGRFYFHDTDSNNPEDYAEDITVTNCEIKNYGQIFFGASGITLTYCDTAEISHNEIHDGYYTGISAGYTWLFFDNPTQNISIKDNLIYDIGHHMISDLGGIYLLGVQQGTVVSGNVIHDVTCYDGESGYAGTGIYLDSGCQFITIENNLVFNVDTSAYNTTLSKDNIIRNNIFAFSGQSCVALGMSEYGGVFTDLHSAYNNNILLTDNNVSAIEYLSCEEHFCGNNNIIWDNTSGKNLYFAEGHGENGKILRRTAELRGYLGSAVYEDPGFVNASEYDFTFTEDSYAVSHGFTPIDYDNAGTLDGTVIGFSVKGGQTPYNSNVKITVYKKVSLNFFEKIKSVIYTICKYVKGTVATVTGLTEKAKGTDFYKAFFEKRTDNDSTLEIETLLNNVKKHIPTYRVDETRKPFSDDDRISAIYFEGEDCQGRKTEVFAYYGIPEGASSLNPVPAIVLVHGGGQHAQADFVQYWVDRGYAAIAIDGFGQQPDEGEYVYDVSKWSVNPNSHITYTGFEDSDKPFDEQWYYYFVSDILLANNILRNDSRVIRNEIGVMGISWGGIATSTAIGYDERFAFAIPVYGCPYACESSAISGDSLFVKDSENIWEASLKLSTVSMPVLLINGNDDPFFSPDCATTAAAYLKNGNVLLYNGISHGKFNFEEAIRFANEVTGNGDGNIHITGLDVDGKNAKISFTLPADVNSAKVKLYVRQTGFEYENLMLKDSWQSVNCLCAGKNAKVTIPDGTVYYYFEVSGNAGDLLNKNIICATTGIFKYGE